ncbi:hypothetical protein [Microcoleus sp. Pol10D4]|uniref:hypothetical protein n=1 Tax=Microcoleus sp. Pol10D4 TaxID=3055387 RepID=UPI002FD63432
MTNFRVASVDGFGDRDDIALARDKSQGQILENQANERVATHAKLLDAGEYGTNSDAQNISQVVKEMIENEVGSKLVYKSYVIWDVDSIGEAVTEACICLGLGDDEFSPWVNDQGFEVEIGLY